MGHWHRCHEPIQPYVAAKPTTMALTSFLKNLLGADNESVATETPAESGQRPRFDNQPGRLFRKEFEATPDAVLLDVRTKPEFASGTIPGSLNLDFMSPAFRTEVAKLDKSKTYFVFCRSGNRSGQACKLMYQMGFDVRNLVGGIGEW